VIHSFPLYIADWRECEDVMLMGLTERGLYFELLVYSYWQGDLPTDERSLRLIARCTDEEFSAAWPTVKPQFYQQDGRYRHTKVDEVRPRLESWRESRRRGADAVNKSRSSHAKAHAIAHAIPDAIANAKAHAIDTLERTPPSSSSSSSSSSSITPPPPLGGAAAARPRRKVTYPEDFEEAYGWYPRNEDKFPASKAWAKLTQADKDAALEGVKRQLPALNQKAKTDGISYIPLFTTWLNKRRWENGAIPMPTLFTTKPPADAVVSDTGWMTDQDRQELEELLARDTA